MRSVVADDDTPPVLELGEQVVDIVALAVEGDVVSVWDFAASFRRDARLDTSCLEFLAKPGIIVAWICKQVRARGNASSMRRAPL